MKSRKPLLKSLLAKLRKKTATAEGPARQAPREPAARKVVSSIEGLEGRIAPATLLSASTVLFTDHDGDLVTVKFSKAILTDLTKANAVLKFSTGTVLSTPDTTPQRLQLIDLTQLASVANGVSFSVTAVQAGSGEGLANVGRVNATALFLGNVTIDGDLGQIDAGRATAKTAIANLTIQSLGAEGTATQLPTPTPDLVSNIVGAVGTVKVFGDIKDARLSIAHGTQSLNGQTVITAPGNLGGLSILGSLRGRTAVEVASDNTGLVDVAGTIGSSLVGTDAAEGIFGGGGANSGMIRAGGAIKTVAVLGSVTGGDGASSGSILSTGSSITKVTISGDLKGGAGENSGRVQAFTALGTVAIAGDIIAGTGASSGSLLADSIGVVTVQDIDGRTISAGSRSGGIFSDKLTSLTVNGSIFGGPSLQAGSVEIQGDIGKVIVRGSIIGAVGQASGAVIGYGKIASVTVSGNLTGGDGIESGGIVSGFDDQRSGDMGVVKILGRVEGGVGDKSGAIRSGGALASLSIGTAGATLLDVLKGGSGDRSGYVECQGLLGSLKVIGNLIGGAGDFSGSVRSLDRFEATGEIAGDLGAISITGQLRGDAGIGSGALVADGNLKSLTVGPWNGGTGAESGSVQTGKGIVRPGNSGAIAVLGAFQANGTPGPDSASILIGGNLSSLTINGATDGATVRVGDALGVLRIKADVSDSRVTARGQVTPGKTTDVAIGSIAISGNVADSDFLAGYRLDGRAVNPDAQIGSVVVTGSWTASNVVAGVVDTDLDGFGDADDDKITSATDKASIISRIASVVIGGAVSGTPGILTDHFGFVAEKVSVVRIAGVLQTIRPVQELDPANNDVSIREVV